MSYTYACASNQITEAYFYCLVDQINRGTCSKRVARVVHFNGNYWYYTYHLL